jgi:ribosomal protein L40E
MDLDRFEKRNITKEKKMKRFFNKIWQRICQKIQARKQIAAMVCPKCGGRLVYQECPDWGWGFWLSCTICHSEY